MSKLSLAWWGAFSVLVILGVVFFSRILAPIQIPEKAVNASPSIPQPSVSASSPSAPQSDSSLASPATAANVTVLAPVPGIPAAKVFPPTVLPVGWNQGFQSYHYADGKTPFYSGEPVSAYIAAGGKKSLLLPDQQGVFPRLFLDPSAQVSVILQFPRGQPGDRVAVSTADGGYLNQSDSIDVLTLNDSQAIAFQFTLAENPGVYRVNIQKGAQTTTLDFWAGPDLLTRQVANLSTPSR